MIGASAMPAPLYASGQGVEVRTKPGWRPATVLDVESTLGRHVYRVELAGYSATFPEKDVRHPRTPSPLARAPKPPARRPKTARPRTDREPLRLPGYKAWVKRRPCLWCALAGDRSPIVVDPHHHGPKAMGVTADDTWIVPACRTHHDAVQQRRIGDLPGEWVSWEELERFIHRKQVELITAYVRETGELD